MGDFGQRRNSLFRGSHTAHRLQPWTVAVARRKSRPELSDSLLNNPLWVNNSVRLGPHSEIEIVGSGGVAWA